MNDCSSLQHNIPGSFCLVLKKTPNFLPLHQCDQRGRWEKFNPPTKHFLHKNDNVTKYKEKAELLVIGSRIRERDKNNAEYYVGDYYCTLVEMFFSPSNWMLGHLGLPTYAYIGTKVWKTFTNFLLCTSSYCRCLGMRLYEHGSNLLIPAPL